MATGVALLAFLCLLGFVHFALRALLCALNLVRFVLRILRIEFVPLGAPILVHVAPFLVHFTPFLVHFRKENHPRKGPWRGPGTQPLKRESRGGRGMAKGAKRGRKGGQTETKMSSFVLLFLSFLGDAF